MTAPYFETAAFFARVAAKPQLDELTTKEVLNLRERAFDEVYERACKIIPSLMHEKYASSIDKEYYSDLVQAACIGVMKAVESWSPKAGSSLTTWAYRLAQQAVQKEINKELRYGERYETFDFNQAYGEDEESLLHKNDTYETSESAGERTMIWEAEYSLLKQQLTQLQQDVLGLLREGNTYREMSDILGVSTTTIGRIVAEIQQIVLNLFGTKQQVKR